MPSSSLPRFFNALPPYLGGKRRLLPWIFQTLAKAVPSSEWNQLTFLDAFVGGGSVSLYTKLQGFRQLLCNDWSDRSQIIIQALLENQQVCLTREDALLLTRELPNEALPGFIQQHYSPSVFSSRHAEALDRLSANVEAIQSPTKRALAQLLIWHLLRDFVCIGTSIGSSNRPYAETLDGLRDWQELNSKRFLDDSFPRLLQPTWHSLEKRRQAINKGIFTGSPVQRFQMDAVAFVAQAQGDVLYLDPPYPGCVSYESSHRVLDSVLTRQFNESDTSVSPFTKGTGALDALLENARHIPIWLLSYGNHQVSLDELAALVQRHDPARKVVASARSFKHMPHVSRNTNIQELLVLAYL
jgi:adenine-specific DNA methylase